jgi:undecaprenyl-diphosphatase
MLFAIAFSGLVLSGVTKKQVERERPSNFEFAQPQETFYYNSYPSGHTTTSFAIAFMLVFITWDTPRRHWGFLAIGWASLVGLSRIYRGVHWPTDVMGGVCAGLVAACLAYLLARRLAASTPEGADAHAPPSLE